MRRLFVVSCLLSVGLLSQAQAQWTAIAGLDGVCRRDGWTPILLDVNGGPAASRGRLAVPSAFATRTGPSAELSASQYVLDFELPANSRKRLHMCVPENGLEAALVTVGGQTQKVEFGSLRRLGNDDWFMVVAGGESGLLRFLQGETLLGNPKAAVGMPGGGPGPRPTSARIEYAQVPWPDLPTSPLGWDAAETIVLGDGSLSQAPPAAIEALLQWVQCGGTLFVPGGAAAQTLAASPLGQFLPLQVAGTEAVIDVTPVGRFAGTAPPPGPVLLAKGQVASDARFLAGSTGQPLILSRPVGLGQIIMPLFDYGANPFKYWPGQSKLWVRLLQEVRTVSDEPAPGTYPVPNTSGLFALSQIMPQSRLPSMTTLIFFLALYMVILAPGQYLLLKALDKREFAWVVTPAIILLFSFSAYGVSVGTRGNRTVVQSVCIVNAAPGSAVGRAEGATSIFSAGLARYDLECGKSVRGVRVLQQQGGSASGQPTIRAGEPMRIEKLPMNMWSTRSLETTGVVDLQGGIEVKQAEWDGRKLTVSIVNGTSLDFENSGVLHGQRFQEKGALRGSGDWQTVLEESSGTVVSRGSSGGGPPGMPGPRTMSPMKVGRLDIHLLEAAAVGANRLGPCFVGLTKQSLLPLHLRRRGERNTEWSLVIVPLPVQLPAGKTVDVPGWLNRVNQLPGCLSVALPVGPGGGKAVTLKFGVQGFSPRGGGPGGPGGPPGMHPGMPPATAVGGLVVLNVIKGRWVHPYARHGSTYVFPESGPLMSERFMTRDGEVRIRDRLGAQLMSPTIQAKIQSYRPTPW